MTAEELERFDNATRLRILDGAIAETERGIAVRLAAGAHSIANHEANLARLRAQRASLCQANSTGVL